MFGFGRNKKIKQAQEHLDNVMAELEKLKNKSILIGIEKKGRKNIFTFAKGDEIHQIETYNTIRDDIPAWKKMLLG